MKRIFLFAMTALVPAIAQEPAASKPAAPKVTSRKAATKAAPKVAAKVGAPVAQPLTIPADALANPDGTYSYTDKAGKNWTYSKTPFGISKTERVGAAGAGQAAPATQQIRSTDQGETVKFAKQTPFGATTWEKKKSELTDEEKAIFQSQHPDNHQ